MTEQIQIRSGRPEDAAVIADFNQRMALETEHRRLDAATALRGAEQGLARGNVCRYFIAECDGQAVGQAMITYEWSDWRCGMFWWLQSVYVRPEDRRRGVFKALHRHLRDLARGEPGVCGLRLYVERDNAKAQTTYTQLGMRATGHLVFEEDWSTLGTS